MQERLKSLYFLTSGQHEQTLVDPTCDISQWQHVLLAAAHGFVQLLS